MSNKVAEFKVMTEALRGLEDGYGRYGHDDFMVDGFKIKEQDLLLFTSNLPANGCRLKGYSAAKRSAYASFVLGELKINWNVFVSRVIPKYVLAATYNLAENIFSNEYSMFYSIYYHFAVSALAYERLFSNYRIKSELSYVYYSYRHVAEAIVCQNYGARHFILQYSDASVTWDNSQVAFLGCDKYLIWGDIHRKGCEGAENMIEPTGFIHKKAIREISCNRDQVLAKMGINRDGRKAIGFFDESFGHNVKLTETHYLAFWEIIVNTALAESETIILIKPKVAPESHQLSAVNRVRFAQLFAQLKECNNVFIIDPDKWSFIETIGVSDLVITEGMTSSATIALICGINGLYYDQANYQHPLALQFKGRLVFDDPKTLLLMIRKILKGEESALQQIPDDLLRAYDQYPDDRGIEVIRELLAC